MNKFSNKQLQRYPVYLKYLLSLKDNGVTKVSSPLIAKALCLSEEQVRKDLQVVSSKEGKPKSGRNIDELISDLYSALGYNSFTRAAVIGVGHLGKALMNYQGFKEFGFEIICGFDVDSQIIGTSINNKEIYNIYQLATKLEELHIEVAILVTPISSAQEMTNRLVNANIKAIWNFVPIHLNVPNNIAVENVNLASSLAVLEHKIKEKQ